eukprot:CAMPEP_0184342134 /NCGR_PEP_ID=MMETSP1089-20130417/10747_1 /TAXON_ID=38269 ORGANISM="Gloeochaete wittrockiana, Strain SAG46.84" /NCGR_SAMPLE_ID=MMETSP1089 /ASSEMBLY_ACC=CAM_ASM_000445 /LENGTH=573 /DNA_ID=CAMNT_0026670837 /DNA_START=25 /DNA_END=1746 /DNA_ORIENTATION=-
MAVAEDFIGFEAADILEEAEFDQPIPSAEIAEEAVEKFRKTLVNRSESQGKETASEKKAKKETAARVRRYTRGSEIEVKGITDKKLKHRLGASERKFRDAAEKAAAAEILLPAEPGYLEAEGNERTYFFRQENIAQNLDLNSRVNVFDLKLTELGPYNIDYTRNGRHILIGGRKGHVALMDWRRTHLITEFYVNETIRDIKFLHNDTMFAVAQKACAFVYDKNGIEIHRLYEHQRVSRLEFLPYHFLLVSVGSAGMLTYQDISTGRLVAQWKTKLGPCDTMRQNPYNAIINLGHNHGTVSMWSPNVSTPLVKMFCHKGPVEALAVDNTGHYLVTAGLDRWLKVWDVRTYKELHSYSTAKPVESVDISHTGLISVSYGPHVQTWKDAFRQQAKTPYMTHLVAGESIRSVRFCPLEDALGIGHSGGVSGIAVPGAGLANYDSYEVDPFQSKKQRQESEVKSLLEKIQPEMITLNPHDIGTVQRSNREVVQGKAKAQFEANNPGETFEDRPQAKKPKKQKKRKSAMENVITAKKDLMREKNVRDQKDLAKKRAIEEAEANVSPALSRFFKKARQRT